MGCGGSKNAAKAEAKTDAAAPAAVTTPEGDFKVNLENPTCDAGMGIVVKYPEKKYLLVEGIKEEGLIPTWNKANENTPDVQVKGGDLILVINGVFSNSDEMLAECKKANITLVVKRAADPATAPAAEAPAAEAAAAEAPASEEAVAENPEQTMAEAPAAEAPAAEAEAAAAEAPAAEAEAPAADAPAAEAPAAAFGADDATPIEPEAAEVGAGASEARMCNWC